MSDAPWVVLRREDLAEMIDLAVERGRSLSSEAVWMQAEEVASLLGVTRDTVVTYARRDGLPCRYAGKRPMFRRDEVMAWIDERPGKAAPALRGIRGGKR